MQGFEQKRLLFAVFLINFSLFIAEMLSGIFSRSLGLVADSLDMLSDAVVYGLSFYAVGQLAERKKRVARTAGYFELFLALFGMAEVLRRFFYYEDMPEFTTMIVVSVVALTGNIACMILLQKIKSDEVHIKAVKIFTNNDILANLGVIVAGVLVYFTSSKYPDLVIGALVFLLVGRGAIRILSISN